MSSFWHQYRVGVQGKAFQGQAWRASIQIPEARIKELEASPQDNAYDDSFFARFEDEEEKANDYQSFQEVQRAAQNSIQDVMKHENIRHPGRIPQEMFLQTDCLVIRAQF